MPLRRDVYFTCWSEDTFRMSSKVVESSSKRRVVFSIQISSFFVGSRRSNVSVRPQGLGPRVLENLPHQHGYLTVVANNRAGHSLSNMIRLNASGA